LWYLKFSLTFLMSIIFIKKKSWNFKIFNWRCDNLGRIWLIVIWLRGIYSHFVEEVSHAT